MRKRIAYDWPAIAREVSRLDPALNIELHGYYSVARIQSIYKKLGVNDRVRKIILNVMRKHESVKRNERSTPKNIR